MSPSLSSRRFFFAWLPRGCRFAWVLAAVVAIGFPAPLSAEPEKQPYAIPAGNAAKSVKQVARQSGADILFNPNALRGVQTPALDGWFTPAEALQRLLRDTPLVAVQDPQTLSFAIRRRSGSTAAAPTELQDKQNQTQKDLQMIELKKLIRTLLQASVAASVATAQPASDSQRKQDDDDYYELSPFVVDASNDKGYRASTTLAGTRTATSLKDVAAAVTVVTDQFLKDTGATNINEIFAFLPNAEGTDYFTEGAAVLGGSNAFFTTGNTGQQQPGAANGSIPETGTNRLRGLENVTVSRDFFQTNIPVDAYNLERAALNRGPNSVLFGLGKSSGILNYSLKRAQLSKDFGEVSIRIGDEDTFRSTLDYNKVIFSDGDAGTGLALRLVGLYEEGGFREVEPAFDVDRRAYGSLRWKPFRNTDIHLNYERYNRRISRPSNIVPFDIITPWIQAGKPTWDPSVGGSIPEGLSGIGGRPGRARFVAAWDDASAWESGQISRLFQARNFTAPNGNSSQLVTTSNGTGSIPFNSVGNAFSPDVVREKFAHLNTDPSNLATNDDDAWSFSLNQRFMDRASAFGGGEQSLHGQLSFFDENVNRAWHNAFHEDFPVVLDVNEKIPSGEVDGEGNSLFVPNPNFLRPYSVIRQNFNTFRPQDQQTKRLEATYSLSFPEGRWFNRLVLTGLGQNRETVETSVSFNNQIVADADAVNGSSFINATEGLTTIGKAHHLYIGPPVSLSDPIGSLQIDRLPSSRALDMSVDRITFFDAGAGHFTSYTPPGGAAHSLPVAIGFGGRVAQDIDTAGITAQTYLLKDRLVFTYGYREDTVDQITSNRPQIDPSSLRFIESSLDLDGPAATRSSTDGETTTFGLVAHPLPWLSFHYNEAENFSPEGQRVDFLGNLIGNPSGEGEDYGFTITALEDKLFFKVNFFEAAQVGIGDNQGTSFGQFNIGAFERDLQFALAKEGRLSEFQGPEQTNPDLFGPEGWIVNLPSDPLDEGTDRFDIDPRYRATTSFEAEGLEIELVYNPTENWRIMANASQQETVQGLIAPRLQEYIDARKPYWQSLSIWNQTSEFFAGGAQTPAENWTEKEELFQSVRINENKINDQLREWRFNVITSYDFSEGRLDGFGIGGAAHWLDKPVVGFGTTTAPDGSTVLDPQQPFFSDSVFDIKLWLKYSKQHRIDPLPPALGMR